MEEFSLDQINDYCESYTTELDEVLKELDRETHLKTLQPRMLSGPLLGTFLDMISSMVKPDHILEIGTFTGFSAICLAKSLQKGKLTTLEVNPEREKMIRKYFDRAGISERVELVIGDALEEIPKLKGPFQLIFMDAKKEDYGRYYDLVFSKWTKGSYMIVDNVLWSGKVMKEEKDRTTQSITDFCEKVRNDDRVSQIMLPIRDGILILRKESE